MSRLCRVAPEVLATRGEGSYTNKVDVWSLGVILYICLGKKKKTLFRSFVLRLFAVQSVIRRSANPPVEKRWTSRSSTDFTLFPPSSGRAFLIQWKISFARWCASIRFNVWASAKFFDIRGWTKIWKILPAWKTFSIHLHRRRPRRNARRKIVPTTEPRRRPMAAPKPFRNARNIDNRYEIVSFWLFLSFSVLFRLYLKSRSLSWINMKYDSFSMCPWNLLFDLLATLELVSVRTSRRGEIKIEYLKEPRKAVDVFIRTQNLNEHGRPHLDHLGDFPSTVSCLSSSKELQQPSVNQLAPHHLWILHSWLHSRPLGHSEGLNYARCFSLPFLNI